MAVLIRQRLGGHQTRRCDARCYNAKGEKCTCICGGANHGVGLDKAVENSQKIARDISNWQNVKGIQAKLPVVQDIIPVEVYGNYGKEEG